MRPDRRARALPARPGCLSKAITGCPAARGLQGTARKSRRETPGGSLNVGAPQRGERWPPFATLCFLLRLRPVIAWTARAMMPPLVMAAPMAAALAAETGEHHEAVLLPVVEALVERSGGIGDLL